MCIRDRPPHFMKGWTLLLACSSGHGLALWPCLGLDLLDFIPDIRGDEGNEGCDLRSQPPKPIQTRAQGKTVE
eukprot:3210227-Amphidinium_carterae.1